MSKTKQICPTKLKPGMLLMRHTIPHGQLRFPRRIISVERRKCIFGSGYWRHVTYAYPGYGRGESWAMFHEATEILPAEMATILIENPKSTKTHEPRS